MVNLSRESPVTRTTPISAVKASRVTAPNLWLITKMRVKLVQFMLNMFRQVLVMTLKHHKKVAIVVVSQQNYTLFLGSQSGQ